MSAIHPLARTDAISTSAALAQVPAHTLRPAPIDYLPPQNTAAFRSLGRLGRWALLFTLASLLGGGWLISQTVIAGAVVTQGYLAVESGPKRVQHGTGGIVTALLVKEGDRVAAGQPLVILDTTVDQAKLSAIANSLAHQRARLVRLTGERDGAEDLVFPPYDEAMAIPAEDYAAIIASEASQFALRRNDRDGQRRQLRERISQNEEQIGANEAQLVAKSAELDLVSKELLDVRELFAKNLVSAQRVSELERSQVQLSGSEGALRSQIAAGRGAIAELEQMILQVDLNLRAELTDQIATAEQQVGDLSQQLIIARDQLSRSTITAPQGGVIHELAVHTVGGVVQPAETLMYVVPDNDQVIGDVRLSPADVDQLYPGQEVTIHFSAFDRGTTPAFDGTLVSISPDLVTDANTGSLYYAGRIAFDQSDWATHRPDLKLVPGMPIEAFIRTDDRTLLSYLTKPIFDQMNRAFR